MARGMMARVTNPKVVSRRLWYSLNNTKHFLYGHLPIRSAVTLLCCNETPNLPMSFSCLLDNFELPPSDMADLSMPINCQCRLNLHPGKNEYRVPVAAHIVLKNSKTFSPLLRVKSSYCSPGFGLIQHFRAGQY